MSHACLFPHVLPDGMMDDVKGSAAFERASEEEKALAGSRVSACMDTQMCAEQRKKAVTQGKKSRCPNQICLQAWDHALQGGLGFGLVRFAPALRPVALLFSEERYLLSIDDLPCVVPHERI